MTSKVFFVYLDWTLEAVPRVFYVGKGDKRRIDHFDRDNDHWRNIVAKHGCRREIIIATKDESYALVQEILAILEFGTFYNSSQFCWGANKTAGGEGMSGAIHTAQTKKRMSEARTGQKRSSQSLIRMSKAQTGRLISEEHRAKISATLSGKPSANKGRPGHKQTPETRLKIGCGARRAMSNDTKDKLSKMRVGDKSSSTKLEWHDVENIRASTQLGRELASQYQMSIAAIGKIRRFETWKTPPS